MLALEQSPNRQRRVGEEKHRREQAEHRRIPFRALAARIERQRPGGDRRQQIGEEQQVEDRDLAGRLVGEQRVEQHEMLRDDKGDRHHAGRQRADAQHGTRRAHVERDQDRARADRDQRVDRLFGKRRRIGVDDAAIHGVPHQHGERQQRKQRGRRLHDQPRPSRRGAGKLPGGEAEGQRRHAVAGQQRVEDRRPAKRERADDRRIERDPAKHDQHRADRKPAEHRIGAHPRRQGRHDGERAGQHRRPQRAERHVQHQHRRDAGAEKREGDGEAALQRRGFAAGNRFAARDEYRGQDERGCRIAEIAVEIAEGDPERGKHDQRHQRAPARPGGRPRRRRERRCARRSRSHRRGR